MNVGLGIENGLIVIAIFGGAICVIWLTLRLENAIQEWRGVPANRYGIRPGGSGIISKVVLILIVGAGHILYTTSGTYIVSDEAYRH